MKIGALTIGQSPRNDLIPEIEAFFKGAEIIQLGALDGLSKEQIADLAPSGGVQALMALWDFDDFVFFEHFAVDPACRNGGIGGQMLDALLARYDKPACLEAELPETELAARRARQGRNEG